MSEPNPPNGATGTTPATDPGSLDVRMPPPGTSSSSGFAARPSTDGAGSGTTEESEWTDQVADLIVDTVDKVRDRTTGPILKASRAVVYGVVALIVAIPLIVMGIILIGRLLELFPGPIWIPYSVLGALLVLIGLILWGKRRPSRV